MGSLPKPIFFVSFAPRKWQWANRALPGGDAARLRVQSPGLYTVSLQMREDGLRIDRLLLTTDTTYVPVDTGLAETTRQTESTGLLTVVDRIINYDYDKLYRLTGANYTTGQSYAYDYDPVGNRLAQIINGDTTAYLYDAANRLTSVNGETYTFDANGNLLNTGVMTNVFDTANRLVESSRDGNTVQPIYNGVNDRVGQTVDGVTTHFALDVQGLPEVIYTSEGEAYLHLPGVIMTEKAGEVRYLLSDGLGSVRQAVDDTGSVVAYNEFDPYGKPVNNGGEPYGFTGEWWENEVGLLNLRARWYSPESGTFLSVDPVEGEPAYQYVRGNVVNRTDASGLTPSPKNTCQTCTPKGGRNNGYAESAISSVSVLRPYILNGVEIVFDFATMEVAEFSVHTDMDIPPFPIDIGQFSFDKVYDVSYITGFTSEADGGTLENDYGPHTINAVVGGSAGIVISAQAGGQKWVAEDFSLGGHGYWYGGEIAIAPIDLSILIGTTLPVAPEFSYYKSYTSIRYRKNVGDDICNPDEVKKFLNVLQTAPHPTSGFSALGMFLGRSMAIEKFKGYVDNID
jgi:RHS repeat-associated protein